MVRCTETLLMRLFRVFIRAQSEFLFRCYSDPYAQSNKYTITKVKMILATSMFTNSRR
jgi:hypothetical protein